MRLQKIADRQKWYQTVCHFSFLSHSNESAVFFSTFTSRALPNKTKLNQPVKQNKATYTDPETPTRGGCKNLQILRAVFIHFRTKSQHLNSWIIRQLNMNHCQIKTVQRTTYKEKLKHPMFYFVLLSRSVKIRDSFDCFPGVPLQERNP